MQEITWEPRKVKTSFLKRNHDNPKIQTEVGRKRLKRSLAKFGLAESLVANLNGDVINGHSRLDEAEAMGVKEVWVSFPSRELTEKEYKEMNAMFDVARASEIDEVMVENMFEDTILYDWDLKKPKQIKETSKVVYPLVPVYDEKYEAIVIVCSKEIDTVFIKDALGLGKEQSYKQQMVKETSVITAEKFIERWNAR